MTTRKSNRGGRERPLLSLPIGQVGTQFLLAPPHRDHETNPLASLHRASPPLARDVAPDGPSGRGPAPRSGCLRGVEKELHPAFREQNLRDAAAILILKDPCPARPEIREGHRHVEMIELEFHKEIITQ